MSQLNALVTKEKFPRSNSYDFDWVLDNQMGPNALWLAEWLSESLSFTPGMRVLDLGCGKAMTSIFLAREFGVTVWAVDLWIGPDHNWSRIKNAGVEDLVTPLRAEAHDLPFARDFFDAAISIDAYTYFGTDNLYLNYLSRFVRPGGQLGIVVPGLTQPIDTAVPSHLHKPQKNGKIFWEDDCWCFHTDDWWRKHWQRCNKITNVCSSVLPDGWRYWRDFEQALELSRKSIFPSDREALEKDQGQFIGLIKTTAERTATAGENLYDPFLGERFGVDT